MFTVQEIAFLRNINRLAREFNSLTLDYDDTLVFQRGLEKASQSVFITAGQRTAEAALKTEDKPLDAQSNDVIAQAMEAKPLDLLNKMSVLLTNSYMQNRELNAEEKAEFYRLASAVKATYDPTPLDAQSNDVIAQAVEAEKPVMFEAKTAQRIVEAVRFIERLYKPFDAKF